MATLIALLRGVNVGGHQKLPSAVLKSVCEQAGFENPRTYLQSGNVVFDSDDTNAARRLREELTKTAKLDVGVIVRTPKDLRSVIKRNPFAEAAEKEPNRLLVVFLEDKPSAAAKEALEKLRAPSEQIEFSGKELYAHFPAGAGVSKLANAFTEKKLGTMCTARNWNTVTALLAMAEGER